MTKAEAAEERVWSRLSQCPGKGFWYIAPLAVLLYAACWVLILASTYFFGEMAVRCPRVRYVRASLEQRYESLLVAFGGDYFWMTTTVQWVLSVVSYWVIGVMFVLVDLTGKPRWMLKFKVQKNNGVEVITIRQLPPVVVQVLLNQVLVQLPTMALCNVLKSYRGHDRSLQIPTFWNTAVQLVFFILVEEVLFYYSHRLLHHRLLYKHFHKKHHEWTSPIGITAIYCTPLEHVLSNVLPTALGPALMGSHPTVHWLWAALSALYGVIVHSGYHLPFLPSPEMHDFHHLRFNENYGIIGLLDWLHGTDLSFRDSEAFKRHTVIWEKKIVF